jgi:hypothetical protein
VYFDDEYSTSQIINHWLSVSSQKYGSGKWAQDSKEITNVKGWFDYLSKHAARSFVHYQRSPENIPPAWTKTGRVWGYRGDWNVRDSMVFEIDQAGFYAYRRIVKKRHHSNVRARFLAALRDVAFKDDLLLPKSLVVMASTSGGAKGIYMLRRYQERTLFLEFRRSRVSLKTSDSNMGRMMGTSDWIDQEDSIKILLWLGSQGYDLVQG